MRQLKAFMKAKKRGRCKCLTLNMWRCGEFCGCVNECGDVNPTPPVPPVPGFTYTFNKTSTRGRTDLYTAEKFVTGEDVPVGTYTLSVKYGDSELEYDTVKIGDGTDWKELPDIYLHNEPDVVRTTYVVDAEGALAEGTQETYKAIYENYENFMENSAENLYFAIYGVDGEERWLAVAISSFATHSEAEGYDIGIFEDFGKIAQNYGCDDGHTTTVEQAEAVYNIATSSTFKGTQEDYERLYEAANTLYEDTWLEYGLEKNEYENIYNAYKYEPYGQSAEAEYNFQPTLDGTSVSDWTISNGLTVRSFHSTNVYGIYGASLKDRTETALSAGTQEAFTQIFNAYKETYTNNPNYLYEISYRESEEIEGQTYKVYNYIKDGTQNEYCCFIFNTDGQGELTEAYLYDSGASEDGKTPVNFETAEALISQTEQAVSTLTQEAFEDTVEYALDLLNSL